MRYYRSHERTAVKGLSSTFLHTQSTGQFRDQFLGNRKGELSTAFGDQPGKEGIHKDFRIAWEIKIQKGEKNVPFSRVMGFSLLYLFCRCFPRAYCKPDIILAIVFTIATRTISQL